MLDDYDFCSLSVLLIASYGFWMDEVACASDDYAVEELGEVSLARFLIPESDCF